MPAAVLQKPAGELLKALLAALREEPSAALRKEFAAAVGAMVKVASAKRVQWAVTQALAIFARGARSFVLLACFARSFLRNAAPLRSSLLYVSRKAVQTTRFKLRADDDTSRATAGFVLQQVVRHADGKADDSLASVLPAAFQARHDADQDVRLILWLLTFGMLAVVDKVMITFA